MNVVYKDSSQCFDNNIRGDMKSEDMCDKI